MLTMELNINAKPGSDPIVLRKLSSSTVIKSIDPDSHHTIFNHPSSHVFVRVRVIS